MGERPIYAPIPARAFGDDRLSGTDLRLLAAIAAHDRFGRNGSGCFASQRRLAGLINAHEKAVARAASRLAEFGYLGVERNPMNARLVVYRVIYTDADAHAMRGDGRSFTRPAGLTLAPTPDAAAKNEAAEASPIGSNSVTGRSAVTGSSSVTDPSPRGTVEKPESGRATGSSVVTDQGPIGNSSKKETQQNQCAARANIFCETDKRLREARSGSEGDASGGPPDAGRAAAHAASETRLWREADASLSPAEQSAILRKIAEGVRPSAALLATAASLRARGAA
jgi:hypothetical protein